MVSALIVARERVTFVYLVIIFGIYLPSLIVVCVEKISRWHFISIFRCWLIPDYFHRFGRFYS